MCERGRRCIIKAEIIVKDMECGKRNEFGGEYAGRRKRL